MISLDNLTVSYGGWTLFDNISFLINPKDRIGLVGKNGAGKTTLLKLIVGEQQPTSGAVSKNGECTVGYLPQQMKVADTTTLVEETASAFKEVLALEAEIAALTREIAERTDYESPAYEALLHRLNDAQDHYHILGGETRDADIEKTLLGLGFKRSDFGRATSEFSGGWRMRIELAKLLLRRPSIFLLDEPTNYLDADGRERLYNLIRRTSATVLVISHDRTLLNQLPAICELSSQGLTYYSGNYDFYKKQKTLQQNALTQQLEEKQKALRLARKVAREVEERKAKQNVRGEKNSIKKGIPRIMMGALKNNAENSSSRLSSIHAEKAEKLQTEMAGIKSSLPQTDKLKTDFNASHLHVGKVLVKAKDVNFHYPSLAASPMETTRPEAVKELWSSSLTFQLRSGDRLSLKGKNGSGKTTLLKLIMGELHPTDGVMERAGFTSVYLDQEYSLVRNERSVLQQAEAFNHRHLPEHEVKTILNRYLFPRDVWNKPCGKLSGGEKMRLSFCCLMIADNTPDMFILDEPTNNLDIESIEIITATIRDYAGTVIAISHDREFLKDTGIEREILLE